ncbi:MAG: hypothetical protein ABFD07_02050, partial [Methanobacterium sp.]
AVFNAQREMRIIENRLKGEEENKANLKNADINQAKYDLTQVRRNLDNIKYDRQQLAEDLVKKKIKIETLRSEWVTENAKTFVFDESKCTCYACKQTLPNVTPEEAKEAQHTAFTNSKKETLAKIDKDGLTLSSEIKEIEKSIADLNTQESPLLVKEKELVELSEKQPFQPESVDLSASKEYQAQKAIAEQTIPELKTVDLSDQKEIKQVLQDGIDDLKKLLNNRTIIDQNNARIEELKTDEKRYSKELAQLEKSEFAIDSFQKWKMELVEQSVNDRFKIVKFKLFRTLVNGGEEPCCVTTVNNVEFSDLNHAMQINAGLDVINALSGFYGVSAPVIFDNAEAVTSFLPTDSQLIKLYVVKGKELEVVNN